MGNGLFTRPVSFYPNKTKTMNEKSTEVRKVLFSAGKSKQNLPAFWEKRDDGTMMTYVEIVADPHFAPKQAIYINNLETIPEKLHALFVVNQGDTILRVTRNNRGAITFQLYVITDIYPTGDKFTVEADEIMKTDDPTNIIDDFATGETKPNCELFLKAGREKLDIDRKISIYCQTKTN